MWPLQQGRPVISLYLSDPATGVLLPRVLLVDTGAGSMDVAVDLYLLQYLHPR